MAKINLVKINEVKIADADLSAGVMPTVFTTLGDIKEGNCNIDFPEKSTTAEYSEQTQQPYRFRDSTVINKISLELVTEDAETLSSITGYDYSGGKMTIVGNPKAKNKYVVISGENIDGDVVTVSAYNAHVTSSWSGNMGANQETVGWSVTFSMLQDASDAKALGDITVATPAPAEG